MKRFITTAYLVIFSILLVLALLIEYQSAKYLNIWNPLTKLKHSIAAAEVSTTTPYDLIAIGNSQLLSGFVPYHFNNAYNLCVPGTVIIDQYYLLEKYLKHHPPPKVVVVGLFPQNEYYHHYTFWNFQVRYGAYSFEEALDLLYHSVKTNNYFTSKQQEGTVKEIVKFLSRLISFKLNLPNENQDILQKTFTNAKAEIDFDHIIKENHRQKGYFNFMTGVFLENYFLDNLLKTQIAKNDIYQIDSLLKVYFDKTIELTRKHNIQFVVVHMPNKSQVAERIGANTIKGARDYFTQYLAPFSHVTYLSEDLTLPDTSFADILHYNPEGANLFTNKLKQILIDKNILPQQEPSIVEGH